MNKICPASLLEFKDTLKTFLFDKGIDLSAPIEVKLLVKQNGTAFFTQVDSFIYKDFNSAAALIYETLPISVELTLGDCISFPFSFETEFDLEPSFHLNINNATIEYSKTFKLPSTL